MASEPDETRLEEAGSYLAEYLADEDIHGGESQSWFGELGEYAMQLPLDDPLITRAVVYLQPFLDDDERVECAMYPGGEAVRFIEQGWGGDLRTTSQGSLTRWATTTSDGKPSSNRLETKHAGRSGNGAVP